MSLSQIKETDDRLGRIVADAHLRVPDALKGSRLETTVTVLPSLMKGLVSLKSGILTLAETGNVYATFVLFRVFLEHILKTLAVFLKAVDEKSDDFAEQYLRLRIKEAFDYLRACDQAGIQIGNAPKTLLDKWMPEAQSMSAKQIKKMEEPFRYRNLISAIRDLINVAPPNYLSKIIPNYAELSGFVHGGPTAFAKLDLIQAGKLTENELDRIAGLSVSMLYSAHRWLLMLAATNSSEFEQLRNNLDEALNDEEDHAVPTHNSA